MKIFEHALAFVFFSFLFGTLGGLRSVEAQVIDGAYTGEAYPGEAYPSEYSGEGGHYTGQYAGQTYAGEAYPGQGYSGQYAGESPGGAPPPGGGGPLQVCSEGADCSCGGALCKTGSNPLYSIVDGVVTYIGSNNGSTNGQFVGTPVPGSEASYCIGANCIGLEQEHGYGTPDEGGYGGPPQSGYQVGYQSGYGGVPVTLHSRAVLMSPGDSCSTIRGSGSGLSGTVHGFSVAPTPAPAPQTQTGANYVNFPGSSAGTYTLSVTNIPANYILQKACWGATNPAGSGEGLTVNVVAGEDLQWDLGYTLGTGWVQTKEGNVYAAGNLVSFVPSGISPRVFNLNGSGGYPGAVTYGTDYDFNSDLTSKGANLVSSKKWLANETYAATDFYELFYRRFGSPTTPDYDNPTTPIDKPASRTTPYYVKGDMTTHDNWVVGDGETIMFIIDGNLTIGDGIIGGNINITGTGFIAFIVKGKITISSNVGGLYSSSAPNVEGIYITSPTGTFQTGTSSVVGKERFVGKGTFVAGNFLLQRDLGGINQNTTTAAELFLYNPQLLVSMPDSMKDVPVTWQEVAP